MILSKSANTFNHTLEPKAPAFLSMKRPRDLAHRIGPIPKQLHIAWPNTILRGPTRHLYHLIEAVSNKHIVEMLEKVVPRNLFLRLSSSSTCPSEAYFGAVLGRDVSCGSIFCIASMTVSARRLISRLRAAYGPGKGTEEEALQKGKARITISVPTPTPVSKFVSLLFHDQHGF